MQICSGLKRTSERQSSLFCVPFSTNILFLQHPGVSGNQEFIETFPSAASVSYADAQEAENTGSARRYHPFTASELPL